MIILKKGNIFSTQCDVIVNPVNCVGVMGTGLALEFKLRFPDMFRKYQEFCKNGSLDIGKLWIYSIYNSKFSFKKILSFPTKRDWRHPSKIEFIEEGLNKFIQSYEKKSISSIAFPYLGTGKGGIDSKTILDLMDKYLSSLPICIEVWEYDPLAIDNVFIKFIDDLINLDSVSINLLSSVKEDKILYLKQCLDNGNFHNLSELSKIKGIGNSTIEKLFKTISV